VNSTPAATNAQVQARAAALAAAFREIQTTRMQGVPILNPRLSVQAVGFEPDPGEAGVALGVLVTPWFINLVRLPLTGAGESALAAVGESRARNAGSLRADFIGAYEPAVGRFEACSLFSPVLEFVDQAAALATAEEALRLLRGPAPAAATASWPAASAHKATPAPDRRSFLFGRRAPAAPGR
jgi:[NiFe] hydrogenase assembly HybE family chaperone